MKQELTNRGEELNQVRTERNELTAKLEEITQRELSNVELAEVHKQVLEYTHQRPPPETSEVAVNTDHVDMFETVEGKQGKIEMQQLQQTVPPSSRENVPHKKPEQEIDTNVPDDNKVVDQLKLQISQIETQKSKLENEFELYKKTSTMTIEELQSHKLSIESAHSLLESTFNELNTQLEQEKKDKATVENDLATTKTRISEMERRVEAMMTEGQGQISASHVAQETVARVTEENEVLRSQLESFQAEAKEEVTKEKEKVRHGILCGGILMFLLVNFFAMLMTMEDNNMSTTWVPYMVHPVVSLVRSGDLETCLLAILICRPPLYSHKIFTFRLCTAIHRLLRLDNT